MATDVISLHDRILDAAQALVLERGFTATTVDAVLAATGASKGAFFHHFPSKAALARALVERYARSDAEVLDAAIAAAESATADPAEQVLELLATFERAVDDPALVQPGCLFVSFVYEQVPDSTEVDALILESIELWRDRIRSKLEQAAASRPLAVPVDLDSLADQVFTVLEGGFILARATDDPSRLRAQIGHLRTYLSLLLQLPADPSRGASSARTG